MRWQIHLDTGVGPTRCRESPEARTPLTKGGVRGCLGTDSLSVLPGNSQDRSAWP